MAQYASERIQVGTRGSRLAVKQTTLIVNLLRARFPATEWSIVTLRTRGDDLGEQPLAQIGDKGVFVRAIEHALLAGEVDIAVHSLKDVPVDVEVDGLELSAFSARGDARDVYVSGPDIQLDDLSAGARVGTSSLRRRVQLREFRPDLDVLDIRGNVDTRLAKLDAGQYDALILAAAGLQRLGLEHRITSYLPVDRFTPDAGQGILAIQARNESRAAGFLRMVDDTSSRSVALAERAVVRGLSADCHSPVGAYAVIRGQHIAISAMAASEDGHHLHRLSAEAPLAEGEALGHSMGRELLERLQGAGSAPILDHE